MANIYVTKSSTPKEKTNVALINCQADVPEFLQEIVIVSEDKIYIGTCIEGVELAPVNNFIAWERDDSCTGGYNVWCKSNGHETLFHDGNKWYERPTIIKYQDLNWSNLRMPEFAAEAPIDIEGGKIVLHASWGDQTAMAPDYLLT